MRRIQQYEGNRRYNEGRNNEAYSREIISYNEKIKLDEYNRIDQNHFDLCQDILSFYI